MRGIILAAGRGSRMKEKTANKPKCLNKILDKTLLEWQLLSMNKADIEDIVVVSGYRDDMLEGDFEKVKNIRWSETNMVSSLFCVKSSDKQTLISYSDITFKHEYIELLRKAEGDIVIAADLLWIELWKLRFQNPLDDAETFKTNKEGALIEIGAKSRNIEEIEAQYMGLIKLSPRGWENIKLVYDSFTKDKQDKMDMTGMLNEMLSRGYTINVVYVKGGWCEADSYEDILKYELKLKNDKNWRHDWR